MSPMDWDAVPQPVRALAFLRMVHHWTIEHQVGAEFGLDPATVALTIGAIVMAESWFEHRAVNENPFGNRDLGLAQCSDHCRRGIARMADEGLIAFDPSEEDYFDPFVATRVAVVWFDRELRAAGGDVPLAIRAYHRGIADAMDEKGDAYLAMVQRLLARYILTQSGSASWQYLTALPDSRRTRNVF
jgi:hypothetical protein